jgi:hypothetical protein
MLVDIGIVKSLEIDIKKSSEIAKRNKAWVMTKGYSDSEKGWPGVPFAPYRNAVKHCLEPENFAIRPSAKVQARAARMQTRSGKHPTKSHARSKVYYGMPKVQGLGRVQGTKLQTEGADAQEEGEAETIRQWRKM